MGVIIPIFMHLGTLFFKKNSDCEQLNQNPNISPTLIKFKNS